jgi:hypothetical protein
MTIAVTVILIAAMLSVCAGLAMSLVTMLSLNKKRDTGDTTSTPLTITAGPVYWSYSAGTATLGVVLMLAPKDWYGPTWSYFTQLPHNGFGMGACCFLLGGLQVIALWRSATAKTLSVLFFLSGFTYWTAGVILGAEGLLGHQGLMEVPFVIAVAGQSLALSVSLMAHYRKEHQK